MIVSNSSPLISLGNIGKLYLLKECFREVLIPAAVYDEIREKGTSPEAVALQKAIGEEWIRVETIEVVVILDKVNALGGGEKEAISLAMKHKAKLLIDDDTAKIYAKILGIKAHGTLFVLFLAKQKGIIRKIEAIDFLQAMMQTGFYISTDVYSDFLKMIQ